MYLHGSHPVNTVLERQAFKVLERSLCTHVWYLGKYDRMCTLIPYSDACCTQLHSRSMAQALQVDIQGTDKHFKLTSVRLVRPGPGALPKPTVFKLCISASWYAAAGWPVARAQLAMSRIDNSGKAQQAGRHRYPKPMLLACCQGTVKHAGI